MEQYKTDFIHFMVEGNVLKFGTFTLKSGRQSPFFVNTGAYASGSQLRRLGIFYARAIKHTFGLDFDILFGPSYKGIPLAVSTVSAISELYGRDIRFSANRKEIKDHGDKGIFLGAKPKNGDRVLIIEDVTTSGASIAETVPILKTHAPDVDVIGLIVSIDRCEKGMDSDKGALEEIREKYGFGTHAIVTMKEAAGYLTEHPVGGRIVIDVETKAAIEAYYSEYGA